jgi:hypothetical protein
MKLLLATFLFFVSVNAQLLSQCISFQPGQRWQLSDGSATWVIGIDTDLGQGFFTTKLVSGEILADHDLFVHAEVEEETLALQFMFNYLLASDSGSGFKCSFVAEPSKPARGELLCYRGSVAGPQWSEEVETCSVVFVSS